ncbi:MAG: hypothetical protein M1510_01760 [Nitrospirae bacterium]|nr:hypothetical protein [Nitrospirota bacterium]MCL5236924.1 hypothetical protein [Nitrospirota bacterium]
MCRIKGTGTFIADQRSAWSSISQLGPGNDLARLIEKEHPRIAARSIGEFRNVRSVADWLATCGE